MPRLVAASYRDPYHAISNNIRVLVFHPRWLVAAPTFETAASTYGYLNCSDDRHVTFDIFSVR